MTKKNRSKSGFTIPEVLIALTILGLATSVIIPVFAKSIEQISKKENSLIAHYAAKSKLALVGNEIPLIPGELNGYWAEDFRWKIIIEPYPKQSNNNSTNAPNKIHAFSVAVTVVKGPVCCRSTATISTVRLKSGAS